MATCPNCSHLNPPDAVFCGRCGTQFGEERGLEPGAELAEGRYLDWHKLWVQREESCAKSWGP